MFKGPSLVVNRADKDRSHLYVSLSDLSKCV